MVKAKEGRRRRKEAGFTLIELVVVMAVVALLLTIAAPRYFQSLERAKENVLRLNLAQTRDALDKFHADRGVYPETLAALVEQKYLRTLPYDPLTESSTSWIIVTPPADQEAQGVYDLRSASPGASRDGTPYRDW